MHFDPGYFLCEVGGAAGSEDSPTSAAPVAPTKLCAWCRGRISPTSRRDALTCSKRCRQAKQRFRVGVAPGPAATPFRLAYADPPYPGLSRKYYQREEVDHAALLARLATYDGWALSTSARALPAVLASCPPGVRVCAWFKGARNYRSRGPTSAWEPVIVCVGRVRRLPDRETRHVAAAGVCDALIWGGRQHSHPGALVGMKPAAFCEWVFRLLGARSGDTLDDLFPGSGAVMRAWSLYTSRPARGDGFESRLAGAERRMAELGAGVAEVLGATYQNCAGGAGGAL